MTQPHDKAEILGMAELLEASTRTVTLTDRRITAAMLRAYAEVVERIDAAEHLILWNVDNFQDLPLSVNYYEKWLAEARAYIRTHINPPSPLTDALSARGS